MAPPHTCNYCKLQESKWMNVDLYLLQITFGNEATSSIQYVIFTHKEAHDPVKVLEEKTLLKIRLQ